jgi:dTDP-4-amino-4,6-dideoxygalactose transaminase
MSIDMKDSGWILVALKTILALKNYLKKTKQAFWEHNLPTELKTIGVSEANFSQAEEEALLRVIRSGWVSQGEHVERFEKQFAKAHQVNEAVAVSNCTAGLHMTLAAFGISANDEVLIPGLTFVATPNAALYCGAHPVPVDIESISLPHISLASAKKALTPKTKAVIVMHHAGYLIDCNTWRDFANEHNLILIEDAAHIPGIQGVGKHSHAAVYSFFANKNMTSAEGGMITTEDSDLAHRLRALRGHAMTATTLTRARGHAFSYDVTELGYNYRMDELRAAIGIAQLDKLRANNTRRGELSLLYRKLLKENIPDIIIPFSESHPSVWHIMPIILPNYIERQAVMKSLREDRIQTSIHYPPWHQFTHHKKIIGNISLPIVEEYCDRTLTLPLHPGLHENDITRIILALKNALHQ